VDAKKDRKGEAEARELLEGARKLIACRGKKVVEWDLKKAPPTDEELRKHVLGPTGNLRAPTLRKGKTLVVGFHADAYQEHLA